MDLEKLKIDLEKFVLKLGKELKKGFYDNEKEVSFKTHENDLLTKYDILLNEKIVNYLEKNYAGISIINEESGDILKNSSYCFLVDPIDGTRNFVRKIPLFTIGIALAKKNKVIFCINYNPISEELFWAIKDKGAYKNNKRIFVSQNNLENSDISMSFYKSTNLEKKIYNKFRDKVYKIRNLSSCHCEINYISSKRTEAFLSCDLAPWDYSQYLICEEAGGKVTDFSGKSFDLTKKEIILSNKVIHKKILDLLNNK